MKRSEAINATSTQGGITENTSQSPNRDQCASACGLESGKVQPYTDAVRQSDDSVLQNPPLDRSIEDRSIGDHDPYMEDRSLEEHARAIQRYREEYDRACSEAAYDAAAEQAYHEYRAQQPQLRAVPKRTALLPSLDIQIEREQTHGRRESWPKPVRVLPLRKQQKLSSGPVAAFVSIFTLAVTPMLHDCIFFATTSDSFNWIFSAECAAFLAAVLAWSILHRGGHKAGMLAGIGIGLGLGMIRIALWRTIGSGLITFILTSTEVTTVLLFASRPMPRVKAFC